MPGENSEKAPSNSGLQMGILSSSSQEEALAGQKLTAPEAHCCARNGPRACGGERAAQQGGPGVAARADAGAGNHFR